MSQIPILSVIILVPLVGAFGALALPKYAGWGWSLLVGLVDLGACIWLLTQFSGAPHGFQFVETQPWVPGLGVSYTLGVDGMSVFLITLNALLTVIALAASWITIRAGDRSREYLALMLLLAAGMQGVFLATNLLLFYVFWELMLVPAYLLVGMFGGTRRGPAAMKFVLFTAVGSLLMLVGMIALGAVVSSTSHTAFNLDLSALLASGATHLSQNVQILFFLAFFAAFAVKSGMFPFHNWVPDTYVEAPIPVVVLIAGVMAKTGVYGFVRFSLVLFPVATKLLAQYVGALAVIGILYFALQALVAQDFKRLLAYVSISHVSVIVLGIFALNQQGIEGGVLQMVNHGLIIAGLFIVAGYLELRTGSRRLADFGGLARRTPWLASAFMILTLSALGLPGLNSFAGEFLAFLVTFRSNPAYGVIATAVIIPAAWYMLRFFQGIMNGPESEFVARLDGGDQRQPGSGTAGLRDAGAGELAVLAPILALVIILGLVPGLLTSRIEPSITGAVSGYSAASPTVVVDESVHVRSLISAEQPA